MTFGFMPRPPPNDPHCLTKPKVNLEWSIFIVENGPVFFGLPVKICVTVQPLLAFLASPRHASCIYSSLCGLLNAAHDKSSSGITLRPTESALDFRLMRRVTFQKVASQRPRLLRKVKNARCPSLRSSIDPVHLRTAALYSSAHWWTPRQTSPWQRQAATPPPSHPPLLPTPPPSVSACFSLYQVCVSVHVCGPCTLQWLQTMPLARWAGFNKGETIMTIDTMCVCACVFYLPHSCLHCAIYILLPLNASQIFY